MRNILSFIIYFIAFSGISQNLVQDSVLIKKQLDNGLTYYIYPTDQVAGEAHFQLFVKVGSLQETEQQRGLAHFLEHMAFNGTKHFEANELIEFLESKGSKFGHDLNAHTSFEETIYKLKIPTKEAAVVDSTLTIMSDWVHGLLLDPLEVEKERGVVLSEWLSKQSPKIQSTQVFLDVLLNKSFYSERKVIGDTTSLKHFKLDELRAFYEKWYDPSLIAVAISGDINPEAVEQAIIEKFANIPSKKPELTLGNIADYATDSLIVYSDQWTKKTELNYIQLQDVFKDVNTETAYQNYLNRSVLNKLTSERLAKLSFDDIHYNKGNISVGNFLKSKGALVATIEFEPENAIEGISEFNTHFQQIFQYGFTSLEIEKIKKTMLASFKRSLDRKSISASGMIRQMYQDFFYGNMIISMEDEYQLMKNSFSELDSVQVLKALKANKKKAPFHYLLTTNSDDLSSLPSHQELLSAAKKVKSQKTTPYKSTIEVPEFLLQKPPKNGSVERIVAVPEIDAQEIHLSNGAKVIYKKSSLDRDKILLAGFRKGGFYAMDSTNYVNVQYTAPTVAMSGYGAFSREALSYYLAGNSAKVRFLIDKTRSGIFGSSNVQDIETLFELFYLKATQPRIDSLLFKQLKDMAIAKISSKPESARENFQKELKYIVRGKDYTTVSESKESLEIKLQQEALSGIYNDFFGVADNYVLTIITDKELEDVLPYIKTYIGGIPKGEFDNSYKYQPQPIHKKDVDYIKHNGDSPKAVFSLVFQQDHKLKDIPNLEVQNQLLEAILKLKMNKRLREELGVVYGVSVSISATKHPTPLSRQTIALVCNPSDVDKITTEIKSILKGIGSGKTNITHHLQTVKTNLIKNFHLNKQRNSFWTKSIRDYYFNQYDNWKFVTDYEDMVNKITEKEISKNAKKYFLKTPRIKAVLYPKNY
ncbi:M16 family metallopeptidase [Gelidibacter maritimus]|uniref:Insulinase family protein n=1 Tax=Gelidibacter maritimus TaxID=2761487 RepID=A0A7W2M470_9FLAO|nr:M16 family metallopeptidase [Gelidibacter maritimus]MBA6152386.1 insulinase family protein [Gelidibacter maritimus]